jgi:hypothetical protein
VWWRGVLALVSLGLLIGGVTGCFGGRSATSQSSVGVATSTVSSSSAGSSNISGTTPSPSGTGSSESASPSRSITASGYPADVPLTGLNVNPGEKPPVFPAAASGRSQAAANAFAAFFIQTLDWGYATTNSAYMRHYYNPSCGLCASLASGLSKTHAAGHWYQGGRLATRSVRVVAADGVTAPLDYCSLVVVDISAAVVRDRAGKLLKGQGALSSQPFKLCERRVGESWRVTYLIGAL